MSQLELISATDRKKCSRCRLAKAYEEFSPSSTKPDGLHCYCKPCAADLQREIQARKPKETRTRARFARKMRKRFGITLEEYDALVSAPCGLCEKTEHIVLDHCHSTGLIRGPLCRSCNAALGIFGEDPARLRAAAEYLERHA